MNIHQSVLLNEVIKFLNPQPNQNFIDCTVNGGGHAVAILEKNGPNGKVLGLEIDAKIYQKLKLWIAGVRNSKSGMRKRLILVNDSYINLEEIVKKYNFYSVHGVLLDLGLSSWHLEEAGRGFSFLRNEPLDMRYNRDGQILRLEPQNLTAVEIINKWPRDKIEKILKEYGEEKFAPRIAKLVVETRRVKPIKTTFELVEVIKKATPTWYHHQKIHYATKVFQALRIAVNNELENLKKVLPQIVNILVDGGRVAVISYHSLEDRIVKKYFREEKRLKIISKKPIKPSLEELIKNPRSRSAKLRVAEKIHNNQ